MIAAMTKLSVNINKIATLRNTRHLEIPNIVKLGEIALRAGAAGLTVHPRPDERHIRSYDVDHIADLIKRTPGAEYNIEGNPFHNLYEHCARVRPTQATFVPDARETFTSNQGFQLSTMSNNDLAELDHQIERFKAIECRVSLFIDPVPAHAKMARQLGADRIELYTEPYAAAFARAGGKLDDVFQPTLESYISTAIEARAVGLGINAGHDLSLDNLGLFLKHVPGVDEVSIGHALIADALEFGMAETVRKYVAICHG